MSERDEELQPEADDVEVVATGADRPRPSRLRRFVLRPAVWMLAGLAVVALGLSVLFDSALLRERLRVFLTNELSQLLGREVSLGAVDLDLVPLELELRELAVAGARSGDPSVIYLRRLFVQADLEGLRAPTLALRQVVIEGPRLVLDVGADGRTNLPRLGQAEGGERRLRVVIDALRIDDGVAVIEEHSVPLTVDASAVRADLLGIGDRLSGQLVVGETTARLPGLDAVPVSLAGRVTLGADAIELSSLRLRAAHLRADLDGRVAWDGPTRVGLELEVAADLAALTDLGLVAHEEVAGSASFTGRLDWDAADGLQLAGALEIPQATAAGFGFAELGGRLVVDDERVRVDLERGRYREGGLSGEVEVALAPAARAASPGEEVSVTLTLEGVAFEGLLADLGVGDLGIVGTVSGSLVYGFAAADPWRGSGGGTTRLALALGRSGPRLAGELPLAAAAGALRLADAATPALLTGADQLVRVHGLIGLVAPVRGRLDLVLDSEDVGPAVDLIPGVASGSLAERPPWAPAAGSGRVSGVLSFGEAVTAALELDLAAVRLRDGQFDRAAGALVVGEEGVTGLELSLAHGGGRLGVRGRVPYAGPGLDLVLGASDWPVASARGFLPMVLPVDGGFSGELRLAEDAAGLGGQLVGTLAALQPVGEEPAKEGGGPADWGDLALRLSWTPQQMAVQEAVLAAPLGRLRAVGTIGLDAVGTLDLALEGYGLSLAASAADAAGLAGRLDLVAELGGTLEQPRAAATVVARELAVGGVAFGSGDGELTVAWQQEALALHGHLGHLVQLVGGGPLAADEVDVAVAITLPDLAGLVPLFGLPADGLDGDGAGTLRVRSGVDGRLEPVLTLDRMRLVTAGGRLENLEPVVVALAGLGDERPAVEVRSLYLGREGVSGDELFLAGSIGLTAPHALDLRLQSSFDLAILASLLPPGVMLAGELDVLATVGGTLEHPLPNGEAHVRAPVASFDLLGQGLEGTEAVVLFYPTEIVLDRLSAGVAGGRLTAGGKLEMAPERPLAWTTNLALEDVSWQHASGWLVAGSAQLAVHDDGSGTRRIGGTIELAKAYYLRDLALELSQILPRLLRRDRVEVAEADELLASTALDVLIDLDDALAVRNNVASLSGGGELTLSGTLARPVVFGQVELAPGGRLRYAGNDYTIARGLLTFANAYRIEPIIDLVATAEVRDYAITLDLRGTLERLQTTMRSDPPLPDLDVLALVATGRPLGDNAELVAPEPGAEGGVDAGVLLANQAASLLTSRVGQLFRLDEFRIDPSIDASNGSNGRVTVGKRLSRDVYATYTYDPATAERQVVEVEWRVSHEWSVYLTQNGDGTYAVDVRWERAF